MDINFIKYKKIYFIFTAALIALSLSSLLFFGLNLGIDFTGGSILEIEYVFGQRPSLETIRQKISDVGAGEISAQSAGDKGVILRFKSIDEETHQKILKNLGGVKIEEKRFETIGSSVGAELKRKTVLIILLAILAMVVYIAIAFRRVSYPVRSWQYGIATLFILFHDILIPLGVFSALGKFYGIQITIPVIVAFLTVVGYAINNVVVVFDRIRENLLKRTFLSFGDTSSKAINQTFARQINTSLTTLFPLAFIYFAGGETLRYFALALIVGIVSGLYSSLFLAGPFLVNWLKLSKKS